MEKENKIAYGINPENKALEDMSVIAIRLGKVLGYSHQIQNGAPGKVIHTSHSFKFEEAGLDPTHDYRVLSLTPNVDPVGDAWEPSAFRIVGEPSITKVIGEGTSFTFSFLYLCTKSFDTLSDAIGLMYLNIRDMGPIDTASAASENSESEV